MKIFNLGAFKDKTLKDFHEFSNTYWEEDWVIYIESGGGSRWIESHLLEILNKKITLGGKCVLQIAMAYSSAFSLMFNFIGEVVILNCARGMYHQSKISIDINLQNKGYSDISDNYADTLFKMNKQEFLQEVKFCNRFMNPKELEDFKKGKGIFFTTERLKLIVKNKF